MCFNGEAVARVAAELETFCSTAQRDIQSCLPALVSVAEPCHRQQ